MAKIRHIALTTANPSEVAEFYKKAFEMEEVRRSDNGAVFLSDGLHQPRNSEPQNHREGRRRRTQRGQLQRYPPYRLHGR